MVSNVALDKEFLHAGESYYPILSKNSVKMVEVILQGPSPEKGKHYSYSAQAD